MNSLYAIVYRAYFHLRGTQALQRNIEIDPSFWDLQKNLKACTDKLRSRRCSGENGTIREAVTTINGDHNDFKIFFLVSIRLG